MDDIKKIDNTEEGEIVSENRISKLDDVSKALSEELSSGRNDKYKRFVMAALGSIPWLGSYMNFISALANLQAEKDQERINNLQKLWIEEHQYKLKELYSTIEEIFNRIEGFGEEVQQRIESPAYLTLVRSTFRSWDQADTEEKRQMLKKLLMNAGASTLCSDDLIRLFIKWIDQYHESHFAVIKEIYKNPGITRGSIWDHIRGIRPREDSADADLFRYLIRDLSTGGVIRQERETTNRGEFMKRAMQHHSKGSGSKTMESAFEDNKPYELTELGKQFIHYVLNEVVSRIEG